MDWGKTLKKALWVFVMSGGGIAAAAALESLVEPLKEANGAVMGILAALLAAIAYAIRDWVRHRNALD